MPFSRSFLSEEQFQCSICLDVFDNPVSTPCGHSFCMACIDRYWGGSKACQCPLCKETFRRKPELHINRTLREITEQFKRMTGMAGACGVVAGGEGGGEGVVLEVRLTKPADLPSDLFTEMKRRFSKSPPRGEGPTPLHITVLSVPTDLSQDDIQVSPRPFIRRTSQRRYTFSGAVDNLQVPLCPKHHRHLELFCRTDLECICTECSETEHQSHDITSAEGEWLNNKTQIGITEVEIQEMIRERLKKVEEIKTSLVDIKMSAERETQGSMRVFSALVSSIERSHAELLEDIEMSRRSAEHQAEGVIRELEREMEVLRRRSAELGKLVQSNDYVTCLQSYTSLCSPLPIKDWAGVSVNSDLRTRAIYQTVCQLLERFQVELRRLQEISIQTPVDSFSVRPQPKVKRIQEYAVDVTLDSSTAHPRLILSEDRKMVKCSDRHQSVPDNPERFDRVVCVLGSQGFTEGRHYWEVEVGGKTDWDLGVASHSINRKGKITVAPSNGYWFLSLRDNTNYAFRTEPLTVLQLSRAPQKIGVFVDYEKGLVSFYNIDARLHIYSFIDTFCETIRPFFSPCTNKSGMNNGSLVITPVTLSD